MNDANASSPAVPGYTILGLVGRGGMGGVFRAREHSTAREVALKWLPGGADESLRKRFQREARAAAAVRHSNVAIVHGAGTVAEGDYIVMELVEGFPLSAALEANALGLKATAGVLAKIARALAAIHDAGLVHRDVKPANIVIGRDGEPRLVDFGLARFFVGRESTLTGEGTVLGTFDYMAPEIAQGGARAATPAADVFSLGCVVYAAIAGRAPFSGKRPRDAIALLRACEPPPLPEGTPVSIVKLLREALAREPASRPSAASFAVMLEAAFGITKL